MSARNLVTRRSVVAGVTALSCSGWGGYASTSFSGATLTIIVGFPPGGGVDGGARLIGRHLPRFLEGQPNVVVQNMPGAGGLLAADHLFNRAPRDGLTLGVPGRNWPLAPLVAQREARFKPLEFEYVGSTGEVTTYVWINKALGVTTPEEFKSSKREIVFGGFTPDTEPSMVPKILSLEGYPAKAVSGYAGTAAIINAIERGEVDGIATNVASFGRRPDIAERCARVFQALPSADTRFPVAAAHVSPRGKGLLQLAAYASATGMPLVAPPGSPPDRLGALRSAFDRMARDAEFAMDADKIGEPHGDPVDGETIKRILATTLEVASPDLVDIFRSLAART